MCVHVEPQDGKPERKCSVWTKKASKEKCHHWNPTQVKASKLVHVSPPQIESIFMLYIPPKKRNSHGTWVDFFFFFSRASHDLRRLRALLGRSSSSKPEVSRPDDNDTDRLMFHRACVCALSAWAETLYVAGGSAEQAECSWQQITGPTSAQRSHQARDRWHEWRLWIGKIQVFQTVWQKRSQRSAHVDLFSIIFQLKGLFMKLKDGRTKYNGTAAASGFPLN